MKEDNLDLFATVSRFGISSTHIRVCARTNTHTSSLCMDLNPDVCVVYTV